MLVGARTVWLDLWEGIQNQHRNNHYTPINKHNNYTPLCQMLLWVLFGNQWFHLSAFAAGESWYINPPTALATHFPFETKAGWYLSSGVLPIGAPALHLSLSADRGKRDLGAFLASPGMTSCLTFPLNISTSTVSTTNNLNEKSIRLWGSFPYGPILCWIRAASSKFASFQSKRKGYPHSASTIPPYQTFTFSNIPQAQFLFTILCGTRPELV